MKRKTLVLGILVVLIFTLGFSFGQEQEQQEQKPPFIQLYGNNWVEYCADIVLKSFDELGLQSVLVTVRDKNGMGGIVELLYLTDKFRWMLIAGKIKPFLPEEQGFFLQEDGNWILTKQKQEDHCVLRRREISDQDGNPLVVIYLFNIETNAETDVRIINLKELVK